MLDMEMCLLPRSTLFMDLQAWSLTPDNIQDLVIIGDASIKPELCECWMWKCAYYLWYQHQLGCHALP